MTALGLIVTLPVDNFGNNLWITFGMVLALGITCVFPVDNFWGVGGAVGSRVMLLYPLAYKKD